MNNLQPGKLIHSKWTAKRPTNKEKHFLVTRVEYDDDGSVACCYLQAVYSGREFSIDWQELKDSDLWLQGWQ